MWGTCIGIYAGQYYDSETGLHYNWHRYYDPNLGRYLRADPIGISKSRNSLFNYADNNPVNYYDPRGLCKWTGWMSLAGYSGKYLGSFYASFRLESECCNGWKVVNAEYRGLIVGISIGIPITAFQTEVTFEGPDTPNGSDGSGAVSYISAGGAAGVGYGAGWLGIGKLAGFQHGMEVWLDGGVDASPGYVWGSGDRVCCNN